MVEIYIKHLLKIKTFIPQLRANLVPRTHLVTKLNKALDKKLIVINAPAGYGKSTLTAEWLKQIDCPAAWVSLDGNDNDLGQFLSYIVLSLKEIQKDICDSLVPLINSPQPPSPQILINNFLYDLQSLKQKSVLVLDDYHLIHNKSIHNSLEYFVHNIPENLHLVIISRAELPFPVSTLRVSDTIIEMNIFDLKFNIKESVHFIKNTFKLNLSDKCIEELTAKTDGWVSGLQLAALGMKGYEDIPEYVRNLSGDDRLIESYFIDEVFAKQSEVIKNFLIKTSILDEFCPELCDYLLQIENSANIIYTLEKDNVFIIPLDNKKTWFRYHHLFSELLFTRLKNENRNIINNLYTKAAKWYEENGNKAEAIEYSLRARDYDRAGELIENLIPDYIARGGRDIFLNWLNGFPREILRKKKL